MADLIENLIPRSLAEKFQNSESPAAGMDLQCQRYTVILSFREDFCEAPKLES